MPIYDSPDGRIRFAMVTPGEGDGNSAVYVDGVPVWDWFSWLAAHGERPPAPAPITPPPDPARPPLPATGGRLIRVTDERDGPLVHRMNSYYPSACVRHGDTAFVFVGHRDEQTRFFQVDLATGAVERLPIRLFYTGEANGWYWNAQGRITLIHGSQLRDVNPFSPFEDNILLDIADPGAGEGYHPGCDLWQAHSSDDGQAHSATVRTIVSEGKYPYKGTVVFRRGRASFFPAIGELDESAIDPTGEFVVIKEKVDGLITNRIIELASRQTQTLTNAQGAVGHSDLGPAILIGEWSPQHGEAEGQCVAYDLRGPLVPERRKTLFFSWNVGHLSVQGGRILLSDPEQLSLVGFDGGVTPLLAHGMRADANDYDGQVQGNLDRTGRAACFMSNREGRLDAYLYVI